MKSTAVRPRFKSLTDVEVAEALSDTSSPAAQLIMEELIRLLAVYSEIIAEHGCVPAELADRAPPTALERLALSMVKKQAGKL